MHLRSKFVDKKINKKVFTNFIKDLKKFDKLFFKKSYFILENIYKKINFVSFKYNFTKNVKKTVFPVFKQNGTEKTQ